MTNSTLLSRRAAVAAWLGPLILPARVPGRAGRVSPNDRTTVGLIGAGRQTMQVNLKQFFAMPEVQVVAVCEADVWRLENARAAIENHYAGQTTPGVYKGCAVYRDYRELLANRSIDAVMIGTPDHWHVPMSLEAVKGGKDVSCEKPLTRTIAEGRALADAVRKHKRVFRTDSEFRSLEIFHRACELVRNGAIGKLRTIRTGVPAGDVGCPPQSAMPVPPDLDYERWQGPAPRAPYTEKRVHTPRSYDRPGWMRHLYYCDGMITNWGAHLNDIAQWGNGTDRTGPVEVEGRGNYPPAESFWNVLLDFEVQYRFANGVRMIYSTGKAFVQFEGEGGEIYAEYPKTLTAKPASVLETKLGPDAVRFPLKSDKQDFIDAVRSRGRTLEDAEVGHRTTSLCHLGHIAIRTGKKLEWDPARERFTNDEAANRWVKEPIRDPRNG
jgi:myo-inositol 2-dehydrogenase / D-chiro-inositol 1-dehydrogenase